MGSSAPVACDPGHYCASDYLSNTSGLCDGGYYCYASNVYPDPNVNNVTGNPCPMGAYCPEGSTSPIQCQNGYYLNSTHNDDVIDCVLCTPGMYCAGSGNEVPDGYCDAGWYCPGGQDDPRPEGFNCTLGSWLHVYNVVCVMKVACVSSMAYLQVDVPRTMLTVCRY